jgi:hypothetical protein
VVAVLLIFWPLLYLGNRWGNFNLWETLTLAAVWVVILLAVLRSGASQWWFAVPASVLTIFMIFKVLGGETKSGHYI